MKKKTALAALLLAAACVFSGCGADKTLYREMESLQKQAAALESGIVQKVQAYIAPKLFGGQTAKTPVEGAGVPLPDCAFQLKNMVITQLGEDILLESEVASHVHRDC